MRFSSLSDWLGWLEKSHPTEIDLGLARISQVAERLQLLNPSATVITVAGTNGKGSCVNACAGLLRAADFSVGVYTSPHLLHYAERIQINGSPVADADICNAFEKVAEAAGDISLTYFEYGTLAALEIFNRYQVDYMVLEVGLGGRLDAINIIDPDLAIITSIDLDHQDWLGNTRELIGREKAGILRPGQLFVCADSHPPQTIKDLAGDLKTRAYYFGQDFDFVVDKETWQWRGRTTEGETIQLPVMIKPQLPLPSMAAAVQALFLLRVKLPLAQIEATLASLTLPGRFQKISYHQREFILDVAHNPAATAYLANRLAEEPCVGKTHGLVAMMADKDCAASLANLNNSIDFWYLLELPGNARAATSEQMTEHLNGLAVPVQAKGEMPSILAKLIGASSPGDRVVVFGSFYTVAAVLQNLSADNHNSRNINA